MRATSQKRSVIEMKVEKGTIYQIDFKEKRLEYTYTCDFKREEQLKVELCKKLDRSCDIMKELYSDDRIYLEWLDRTMKQLIYKIKEN